MLITAAGSGAVHNTVRAPHSLPAATPAVATASAPGDRVEVGTMIKVGLGALVGAGLGVAAGLNTGLIGGAGGALVAFPVGAAVGGLVGGIGDLLRQLFSGGSYDGSQATTVGLIVGGLATAAGGAWLGATSASPWAAVGLGLTGLITGAGTAGLLSEGFGRSSKEQALDLDKLKSEVGSKHAGKPEGEAFERAVALAEQGWRLDGLLEGYRQDPVPLTAQHWISGPGGESGSLSLADLAAVDYFQGQRTIDLGSDLAAPLAEAVEKGRLSPEPESPAGQAIRFAGALRALASGDSVKLEHKGIRADFKASTPEAFETNLQFLEHSFEVYDKVLEPAVQSELFSQYDKNRLASGIAEIYNANPEMAFEEAAHLLVRLGEARRELHPDEGAGPRTAETLKTLEILLQSVDAVGITEAVPAAEDLIPRIGEERFRELWGRAGGGAAAVGGDGIRQQVALLSDLGKASAAQPGHPVMFDYLTLVAGAGARPLAEDAADYVRLLEALSGHGLAHEAAPAFAAMRESVNLGQHQETDMPGLVDGFLSELSAGKAPVEIRRSLLGGRVNFLEEQQRERAARERLLAAGADEQMAGAAAGVLRTLTPAGAEAHLKALETLAQAGSDQPEYQGLVMDYTTLMLTRDRERPVADQAADYGRLLAGLARLGQADQAGPTYAFFRRGQTAERYDTAMTGLVDDFLGSVLLGTEPDAARRAVALQASSGESTVTIDEDEVHLGDSVLDIRDW